jgi:mannosyl-3-phosphoglycerate phosphatase
MARLVVFTDLDGTLLDPKDGRWEAARPGLERLATLGAPLVLCTTKTRAEVLPVRQALGLADPFVTEYGGGVYIPRNYFPFALPTARVEAGFQVLELGTAYDKLVRALEEAAQTSGVVARGFHRMTDGEVAKLCKLDRATARRARQREFDEPFLLERGTAKQKDRFFRWLEQRGLRWREGARFLHLMGDNDKGVAVARLIGLYRQQYGEVVTVGLGDSRADLDFLAKVDRPLLLTGGESGLGREARTKLPRIELVAGAGPAAWNDAVLGVLRTSN